MTIDAKIKNSFEEVTKAYFEKEANANFLRVEVIHRDMDKITELSRKINEFVDENDKSDAQYFLDIFSPGTDEEFDVASASEHVGKNIYVSLNKNISSNEFFIGELIEVKENEITVKWNAKGQFRKQPIDKENIKMIKHYAKIKKEKK